MGIGYPGTLREVPAILVSSVSHVTQHLYNRTSLSLGRHQLFHIIYSEEIIFLVEVIVKNTCYIFFIQCIYLSLSANLNHSCRASDENKYDYGWKVAGKANFLDSRPSWWKQSFQMTFCCQPRISNIPFWMHLYFHILHPWLFSYKIGLLLNNWELSMPECFCKHRVCIYTLRNMPALINSNLSAFEDLIFRLLHLAKEYAILEF